MSKGYKLIGDRENMQGSIEYNVVLGEYDTFDEARAAREIYLAENDYYCYSGLYIEQPECVEEDSPEKSGLTRRVAKEANMKRQLVPLNQSLVDYLETEDGHNRWDSHEIQLVLQSEVVFILQMNEYVQLDKLGLIDEDHGFTSAVNDYWVEGATCINETNFVFIRPMTTNKTFEDVIDLLLESKWAFEVGNTTLLTHNEPITKSFTKSQLSKELRYVHVIIGRDEWIITEDNSIGLNKLYNEIEGWS